MEITCAGIKKLGIEPHTAPADTFAKRSSRPKGYDSICKPHKVEYNRARLKGTIQVTRQQDSMASRFLTSLNISKMAALTMLQNEAVISESGCWNWKHSTVSGGYAAFRLGNRELPNGVPRFQMVHKWAYWLVHGDTELTVHHKCANKTCFNPDHLEAVTLSQNIGEMLARKDYKTRIKNLEQEVKQLKLKVQELEQHIENRG